MASQNIIVGHHYSHRKVACLMMARKQRELGRKRESIRKGPGQDVAPKDMLTMTYFLSY